MKKMELFIKKHIKRQTKALKKFDLMLGSRPYYQQVFPKKGKIIDSYKEKEKLLMEIWRVKNQHTFCELLCIDLQLKDFFIRYKNNNTYGYSAADFLTWVLLQLECNFPDAKEKFYTSWNKVLDCMEREAKKCK